MAFYVRTPWLSVNSGTDVVRSGTRDVRRQFRDCPGHSGTVGYPRLGISAACPSGSERRFYDGHDRKVNGSTSTQALLLRPWIRCFTAVISARWNLTSSKSKKSEAQFKRKTRKQGQLLSESGFVLCIAPPSLSRDRRIKMKKIYPKKNLI